MGYGRQIDPNDIRWNDAQFVIQRIATVEDNIHTLLHETDAEYLKQLVILLDSYLLQTWSIIQYDKTKYEEILGELDSLIYRMDMNKDGRIDEEEQLRNRKIIAQIRLKARQMYSELRALVTPYLSIDIKKILKELRTMMYYKQIDKLIDRNIIFGMEKVCPNCKETFEDEETIEVKRVHEHSEMPPGEPS